MTNVQVGVRLRWEARMDAVKPALAQVLLDRFSDEIGRLFLVSRVTGVVGWRVVDDPYLPRPRDGQFLKVWLTQGRDGTPRSGALERRGFGPG